MNCPELKQNAPDSVLPLLEEQLRQGRRRRQTELQKQIRLLTDMANSILAKLHAILGFSELLAENKLPVEQHQYVRSIYQAGNDVVLQINNVLEYLKIKQGKAALKFKNISLADLLREIDAVMRPRAHKKNLKFNITRCGCLPADMRTDASHLRQLLLQLAEYALNTADREQVGIEVSQDNDRGDTFIRFDFTGGGRNLNLEKKKIAFQPYAATAGNARLFDDDAIWDLIIAHQLAQLLQGRLSVINTQKRDAVFSVFIPTDAGPKTPTPTNNSPLTEQNQCRAESEIDELLSYIMETYICARKTPR